MLGLFRPFEQHVGPSIVTAGVQYLVVLLGWMLKFVLGISLYFIRNTQSLIRPKLLLN
jgi:hypothetical protein